LIETVKKSVPGTVPGKKNLEKNMLPSTKQHQRVRLTLQKRPQRVSLVPPGRRLRLVPLIPKNRYLLGPDQSLDHLEGGRLRRVSARWWWRGPLCGLTRMGYQFPSGPSRLGDPPVPQLRSWYRRTPFL
jgi:hypothetical protein